VGGISFPSISANGTTNGILWVLSGGILLAFNASDLEQELLRLEHGSRPRHAPSGRSLRDPDHRQRQGLYCHANYALVYGILENLTLVSGGNQNGTVKQPLPAAIMMQVVDPYSGNGISGVTVTFSDNGAGGSFNPASVVSSSTAGSIGDVSTIYTRQNNLRCYYHGEFAGCRGRFLTETAVLGPR